MTRNRLYLLLAAALAAGYGWLAWSINETQQHTAFTPCPIKNITGIACPSCGTTRSVMHVAHGQFADAVLTNPIGIIVAIIMATFPFWLLYDVLLKKDTLYRAYKNFETTLRIQWVAVLFAILIIANWIWNIQKGL